MKRAVTLVCLALLAHLGAGCNKASRSRVDPNTGLLEVVAWAGDRRHGRAQSYSDSNLREEGSFEHGLRTGVRSFWHENGAKERELFYVEGLRDGLERRWHEQGELALTGTWAAGVRVGTWFWYGLDGVLIRTEDFEQGTRTGVRVLREDGRQRGDPEQDFAGQE